MQTEDTIGVPELTDILGGVTKETVARYLNSFRFARFRTTNTIGYRSRYLLNTEFLSILYTLLDHRGRYKEARNLEKHFKSYKVSLMDWEDFLCLS